MEMMTSVFRNEENFHEDVKMIARDFINTLHKCRMFLDLKVTIEILEAGIYIGDKYFACGDTIVVLEDGRKEAVNITGNSGMATIDAIWKGIQKVYDFNRPLPLPKVAYERVVEMARDMYDKIESLVGEGQAIDWMLGLGYKEDELETIGINLAHVKINTVVEAFFKLGFDLDTDVAEYFLEVYTIDDLDNIEDVLTDEQVVESYFEGDLDYHQMDIIRDHIDWENAARDIADQKGYYRLTEDVNVVFEN